MYKIINKTSGSVLSSKALVAKTFLQRLKGLMFREGMEKEEALMFYGTGSIHTCFMKFPIDLVFLNKNNEVIRVCEALKPWRSVNCPSTHLTIELPPHRTREIPVKLGDILELLPLG